MLHFEIINIDAAPKDFCLKVWPGGRNLANLLILSTGQIPSDGPGLKAEMHKPLYIFDDVIRKVVQKKNYFTVMLTLRVDPPPTTFQPFVIFCMRLTLYNDNM